MGSLCTGLIGAGLLTAVAAAGAAQAAPERTVQAQMRNVAFHVDSTTVLAIHYARGTLRRTAPEHPAYLDDKHSFVLDLDTARIGISPAALSQVLNRYTVNYFCVEAPQPDRRSPPHHPVAAVLRHDRRLRSRLGL